ncbi:hypothetical protein HNO89_003451 [Sporosarcina luteola]|nr:hypothetical protein [Sporosarcina luteola]
MLGKVNLGSKVDWQFFHDNGIALQTAILVVIKKVKNRGGNHSCSLLECEI